MIWRHDQNRFSGRTLDTGMLALGALAGSILLGPAETARAQWGSEPQASVMVEGGYLAGRQPAATTDPGAGDPAMIESMYSNGNCHGCADCDGTGSGCCGTGPAPGYPSAIFDTTCPSDRTGMWVGRVDGLILWRSAPPGRPLATNPLSPGGVALDAAGMDSTLAAGPRFTLMRVNACTGHAVEATYFRGANFRSERPLSNVSEAYTIAPPGIYGNPPFNFEAGNANLGSRIQSFEFNRHHAIRENVRFLAGFRWVEWEEDFAFVTAGGGAIDFYQTECMNSLYGGQIGIDANILNVPWVRFDGVVKAGAYYNNSGQSSLYVTNAPPGFAAVAVGESPSNAAFVGEVGFTAVVPVTPNIDIRLGYLGLWLSGIAQPTQQLSGQQLTPGQAIVGSLNNDGGVLVQGVSLGIEGRY